MSSVGRVSEGTRRLGYQRNSHETGRIRGCEILDAARAAAGGRPNGAAPRPSGGRPLMTVQIPRSSEEPEEMG